MKTCYYELLGVDKDADAAQLKKAYRLMSLKYHPDKNKDSDAKEKFQEINEAYEVLNDPNERTWYDNHKTQILSGKSDQNTDDLEEASFGGLNVKGYLSQNCFKGFDDSKQGFYSVYRDFFEKIKYQEEKAFQQNKPEEEFYSYPGFGDSKTDPYKVHEFYQKWENFITFKNFSWADQYRQDEESRYVRRLIEKENNKFRREEKKNYLDTLKKIVDFVFKRDPRYQTYIKMVEEEQERKKQYKAKQQIDKENNLKEMRKQQRIIEQQRLLEEELLIKQGLKVLENQDQFAHIQEKEFDDLEDFYCQVCDKEFKSIKSLENHKNSKLHKKNMQYLIQEVGTEEEIKNFSQNQQKQNKEEKLLNEEIKNDQAETIKDQNINQQDQIKQKEQNVQDDVQNIPERKNSSIDEQDDYFFQTINKQIQRKNKGNVKQEQKPQNDDIQDKDIQETQANKEDTNKNDEFKIQQSQTIQKNDQEETIKKNKNNSQKNQKIVKEEKIDQDNNQKQKIESKVDLAKKGEIPIEELSKAKLKKLKKLEKQDKEKDEKFKCQICSECFPSKTKLFKHCEQEKHFALK